ncbi:MFS transporter [Actinocatenispora thailandica]|uniref:MFS transporter n=1 Tax=Actinocatenispora thailandica TaxID=227318 RepID=A0A7R7DUZ1_9ACTN|nr:MFS transporter [Actinocatenispora thailandica]BCJ38281.1 MFS transporter [Actinocatenispora thailandica]
MRKWGPLLAVCLGNLMLMIDVTIVVVALPTMGAHLHASFGELQWVIDGYALVLAAVLLTAGSLADRYGRRRAYLAGLVVFAAASLASALAPNAPVLIAARAVQGVGGAAMLATSMALLTATYSGRDRGVAFGVWGAVSGASAAAGPIAGGLLTEYLNWQSIFLVNVPVCVVAVALSARVLTESRNPHAGRLDLPGMAGFSIASGALTYALIRGAANGWTSAGTLVPFALAAVSLVVFLAVESRRRQPMLDLSLFRNRSVTALLVAALLLQAGAFGYLPYTSLWLQSMLGDGPVRAGLVGGMALSAAGFVVSALGGRLLHDVSPKLPVGVGLLVLAAGDLLEARLTADAPGTRLIPGLLVAGVGMGLALPTLSSAVMAAVPSHRAGMAGGALNTFRQLGQALGIAVLGAVFAGGLAAGLPARAPAGTAAALAAGQGQAVVAHVPAAARDTVAHALRGAFAVGLNRTLVVSGVLAAVAGVLVLTLVAGRRADAGPASGRPESAGGAPGGSQTGAARPRQAPGTSPGVPVGPEDVPGASRGVPVGSPSAAENRSPGADSDVILKGPSGLGQPRRTRN